MMILPLFNTKSKLFYWMQERDHLRVVAIIMTIVLIIVVLATFVLVKRVVVAVAVLKVSMKSFTGIFRSY
jgi:hypothetical protein